MPTAPALEIVSTGDRMGTINAHAYGSFRVDGGGGTPAVITSGPANFPGAPKAGPGTCANGLWYNSQGKPTSGNLTKPHPHCIKASAAIEVVLEPISVCVTEFSNSPCAIKVADKNYIPQAVLFDKLGSVVEGYRPRTTAIPKSEGAGTLTAYAIDASTLGTTNKRVGTLTLDLTQFHSTTENYLPVDADGNPDCTVDPAQLSPCLNKVIDARYNPLPAPDGLGPADFSVAGYLWLTPASSPYNYSDMPVDCHQQLVSRLFGGVDPNLNIGDIATRFDAQSWCEQFVTAANVPECQSRLMVLAGILPPSADDPCLSAV
jgi:hypothetical protein